MFGRILNGEIPHSFIGLNQLSNWILIGLHLIHIFQSDMYSIKKLLSALFIHNIVAKAIGIYQDTLETVLV